MQCNATEIQVVVYILFPDVSFRQLPAGGHSRVVQDNAWEHVDESGSCPIGVLDLEVRNRVLPGKSPLNIRQSR